MPILLRLCGPTLGVPSFCFLHSTEQSIPFSFCSLVLQAETCLLGGWPLGFFRFIHSFIHSGHFYSAPSSPLPLRGAPDYSTDTVSEFHAEAHRQLKVKDLPEVPTWRLERESNPRPSGWKQSTQPRRHHVPQIISITFMWNLIEPCVGQINC